MAQPLHMRDDPACPSRLACTYQRPALLCISAAPSRCIPLAHTPQVMSALAYYLGLRYIPDSQVVNELLGVPTHLLHAIVDVSGGRRG